MAHTPTLVRAPGETLADALHDLTKIAQAIHRTYDPRARRSTCGVLVIRRTNDTVVAAFADEEVAVGQLVDEHLLDWSMRSTPGHLEQIESGVAL